MLASTAMWLNQMRAPIQCMEGLAAALTPSSLHGPSSLQTALSRMQLLFQQMLATWRRDPTPSPSEAQSSIRRELILFVMDFTALLHTLVPLLDRLGSRLNQTAGSSVGTTEERVFWECWNFMSISCDAFLSAHRTCPGFWTAQRQPLYHALFTANSAFLEWLLSFSRSPTWLLM